MKARPTMHAGLLGLALACLVLAAWPSPRPARAANDLDPSIDVRTLHSQRLRVHYPPGGFNLAVRISRLGENLLLKDAALFANLPSGPIDVVLIDNSDQANGSAQVLPKNTLRLILAAPTELTGLSAYDDWLEMLVAHELAHLCDLDQAGGVARAWRLLFGRAVTFNSLAPPWLIEGAAVWAETRLTTTGRGRSSFVEMMLRTAALDDRFLEVDQAHRYYPYWPGGNVPYFYGGRFHLWLSDRLGDPAVADLHRRMAAQPVPYVYWPAAQAALGASLPNLWAEWRDSEVDFAHEVKAQVEAAGVTSSQPLTEHGGDIAGAQWAADGASIVYSRRSPVDGSTLRRLALIGSVTPAAPPAAGAESQLVLEAYSSRLAIEADGSGVFFAQGAVKRRFDTTNDLLRFDLASQRVQRVEVAGDPEARLRGRDPALHPAGDRLLFVANALHQSALTEATFVGGARDRVSLRRLCGPAGDMQLASPAYSPDGKTIAVSAWEEGRRRNILLLDGHTGALVRRITQDGAEDGNPTWSPDGRLVLYESDQDGISNIYAFDVKDSTTWRLTRVVGGASMPAVHPRGHLLLFRHASGRGFDLHTQPMDRGLWEPQTYDPQAGYQPLRQAAARPAAAPLSAAACAPEPGAAAAVPAWAQAPLPVGVARQDEPRFALQPHEVDRSYRAWQSLLPFQHNGYLLPSLTLNNGGDLMRAEANVALMTGGADVLARHAWQAGAGVSRYGRRLNWFAGYQNDQLLPTLALGVADQAIAYPLTSRFYPVQRSRQVSASASWSLTPRHAVGASYSFERRTARPADASFFNLGDLGSLQAGYTYQVARQFPLSISPEHGGQISGSLRWVARALGGNFDEVIVNLGGRAWLAMPWGRNQVVALRLATSFALGPDYNERFYLGGTTGNSLYSSPAPRQLPLRGLGGFTPGQGVVAAYGEYRAPLWQIQRGLWTLPVVLQALHGAVFVDIGNTLAPRPDSRLATLGRDAWSALRQVTSTAGVELRLDLLLGWNAGLTLRAGLASAWLTGGHFRPSNGGTQYYIDLGSII